MHGDRHHGRSRHARRCRRGDRAAAVVRVSARQRHQARDRDHVRQRPLQPRQPERARPTSSRCRLSTNFITSKGTMLSNNHTPLIAHTADDSITNYTGLYGDRHGQGITNSYETYDTSGVPVSRSRRSPYWTGTYGLDAFPNQPYSAIVPAAGQPPSTPPAPWVPFTRAGCDVGDVSTANMVLENTTPDLQNVFGANSPEVAQLTADPDSVQGPGGRGLPRSRGALRAERLVLRHRPGDQVRADDTLADGRRRRAAGRAGWLLTTSTRCSARSTCSRSSRRRPTPAETASSTATPTRS